MVFYVGQSLANFEGPCERRKSIAQLTILI